MKVLHVITGLGVGGAELQLRSILQHTRHDAEVVSLPPTYVIRPDLKIERTGATTRFQTYWFEAEDGDL